MYACAQHAIHTCACDSGCLACYEFDKTIFKTLTLQTISTVRKTKIICTLGPACWSEEGLAALLDAGMNVARFNFSHGAHPDHQAVLDRLKKVQSKP